MTKQNSAPVSLSKCTCAEYEHEYEPMCDHCLFTQERAHTQRDASSSTHVVELSIPADKTARPLIALCR